MTFLVMGNTTPIEVSVPLRGKEGTGQAPKAPKAPAKRRLVSVPLRGKEGTGHV